METSLKERLLFKLKAAKLEAERHYEAVYNLSNEVGQALQQNLSELDEATLADMGFLFRKMEGLLLLGKRECYHKQDQIGRVLSALITRRSINGGELKAVGSLATATPDIKVTARLPKRGTEHWDTLLAGFGVSKEVRDATLLDFHWPSLCTWLSNLEAKGFPVPEELKSRIKQYPQCTYRAHKNKK